jgi:hypothetical protein
MEQEFLDIISLFIVISGFVIGLGAVTVIDLHGFLGRKSSYWTEATIRTHKVTKPLIWIGIGLVIIGGFVFYRNEPFWGIPFFHMIGVFLLIINGIFLSFYVSPFLLKREKEFRQTELLPSSLQFKIALSLIFSDTIWWGSLLLFVWFIVQKF